VRDQLAFCDGVLVYVNVKPKDESSESNETKYDPKSSVSKETRSETETSNSTTANRPSGDVGAVPNTGSNQGMSLGAAGFGGGGEGITQEKTSTTTENKIGMTQRVTRSPAGSVAVMSASVGLPRSFFVKAYKSQTHADKEPSDAVLGPFIKDELDHCRKLVKACLTLPDETALVVDTYADIVPAASDSPVPAASSVSLLLGGHAKEIALGALAVISLFMVSMMVRKGPVPPLTAGAAAHPGSAVSGAGATVDSLLAKAAGLKFNQDDAAEVAGGGGPALEGVELDSDAIRAQQVIEQVSGLVKDNPDAAASLIKRWMNRT
jgi:flagellar biosynthesis/type III secretory pathway M-ring protein FliF/YscJ